MVTSAPLKLPRNLLRITVETPRSTNGSEETYREMAETVLGDEVAHVVTGTLSSEQMDIFGTPEIKSDEILLMRQIGSGSYGKVFKGLCRQLPVAVKVLHKQMMDRSALEHFKKEVKIMRRSVHPNICLFLGACTEPGHLMIVSSLLPRGNVQDVLLDKERYPALSLLQRMKMARDTALGMNWLHCSQPAVIHRDLKSSNLLLDENWNVSVCDFGLSEFITHNQKLHETVAKGSPLWMAPEVMQFEEFDKSCDVYSFGIVLWELLTRQEPFSQYAVFEEFQEAVCVRKERPPLPPDTPRSIQTLMEKCWDHDPSRRPTFADIVEDLNSILIDVAIVDTVGRNFWVDNFAYKLEVSWSEFLDSFEAYLGLKHKTAGNLYKPTPKLKLNIKRHNQVRRCLQELLVKPHIISPIDECVTAEQFGKMLQWFGPLEDTSSQAGQGSDVDGEFVDGEHNLVTQSVQWRGQDLTVSGTITYCIDGSCDEHILNRIRVILMQPWFHGEISTSEVASRLSGQPVGTFLIRFSTTQPGSFTISSLAEGNMTKHQRVVYTPGIGYTLNDRTFRCLSELVRGLGLKRPCPGSVYQLMLNDSRFEYADMYS